MKIRRILVRIIASLLLLALGLAHPATLSAQTLLNLDFGVGKASPKTGLAATGMGTDDFWNLYRHYEPKYAPAKFARSSMRSWFMGSSRRVSTAWNKARSLAASWRGVIPRWFFTDGPM